MVTLGRVTLLLGQAGLDIVRRVAHASRRSKWMLPVLLHSHLIDIIKLVLHRRYLITPLILCMLHQPLETILLSLFLAVDIITLLFYSFLDWLTNFCVVLFSCEGLTLRRFLAELDSRQTILRAAAFADYDVWWCFDICTQFISI